MRAMELTKAIVVCSFCVSRRTEVLGRREGGEGDGRVRKG